MTVYEIILKTMLETGPMVSLYNFCITHGLDYSWAHKMIRRGISNRHINATRLTGSRGRPVRFSLTKTGRMYARALPPTWSAS
jgi:hypothetical protein